MSKPLSYEQRLAFLDRAFLDASISYVPMMLKHTAELAEKTGAFKKNMVHQFVRQQLGEVTPTVMDVNEIPVKDRRPITEGKVRSSVKIRSGNLPIGHNPPPPPGMKRPTPPPPPPKRYLCDERPGSKRKKS